MSPREFPHDPDDPVDPALAPLIEAGEGEQDGWDVAEEDLIAHTTHRDERSTEPISRDGEQFPDEEKTDVEYGEADDLDPDEF
jgi:hypothetical protein